MKIESAVKLANKLMNKHGLSKYGWSLNLDNAKKRFGQCRYRIKQISLSKPLILVNDKDRVKDTILHEIAHALVGPSHGHNSIWKAKCIEVGCAPVRCFTSKNTTLVQGKYKAVCGACGKEHYRYRKLPSDRRVACLCQRDKSWDNKTLLHYSIKNKS
jgi:predicted SprT family Zn-dependent metalloprotease